MVQSSVGVSCDPRHDKSGLRVSRRGRHSRPTQKWPLHACVRSKFLWEGGAGLKWGGGGGGVIK